MRFPPRVSRREYVKLEMLVQLEIDEIRPADREPLLEEFRNSYKEAKGGGKGYEFFSKRFLWSPAIGIDTATFHGDSGGDSGGDLAFVPLAQK